MSSTSLSKLPLSVWRSHPALSVTAGFFVLLELLLRLFPAEYGSNQEIFLTNHRRKLIENSRSCFDYVIFGDSRSLSIMGHPPTEDEPWSTYNLSLPAIPPRYFVHYLKKYVDHRPCRPSAVILGASPAMFLSQAMAPYHDPRHIYSDATDESLSTYLWKRLVRRPPLLFSRIEQNSSMQDMSWEYFSARFLHMFSPRELSHQFTGAERIFVLRHALPLTYQSYRYRETIRQFSTSFSSDNLAEPHRPPECNSCDSIERSRCHPPMTNVQSNRLLDRHLAETYGQINLADRLKPEVRLAYRSMRGRLISGAIDGMNQSGEAIDLAPIESLLHLAQEEGIRVVITIPPFVEEWSQTRLVQEFDRRIDELAEKNPDLRVIRFPGPFPAELFVEHVHYDCQGARRLNEEFRKSVMPGILTFARPKDLPLETKRLQ